MGVWWEAVRRFRFLCSTLYIMYVKKLDRITDGFYMKYHFTYSSAGVVTLISTILKAMTGVTFL